MRKIITLAVVATILMSSVEVNAAGRRVRPQVSNGQTPFSRLMDLERRKNAALKRFFFGG